MLQTTVYNQANAVITGCYYDPKGNRINVEFIGTALECEYYVNGIRQDNEGSNEVQSVINRRETLWFNAPIQSNPLMNIWHGGTPVK